MSTGHNWHPFTVRHPQTLALFNDDLAWDFIADCLEADTPVTRKPAGPGKPFEAFEMIVEIDSNERRLYMKIGLAMNNSTVVGLSFHYSTEEYR